MKNTDLCPYNMEEFKALIKRYESITLDEISEEVEKTDKTDKIMADVYGKERLTGFGSQETCTLCLAVRGNCDICVYKITDVGDLEDCYCLHDKNQDTYWRIMHARTPYRLLQAYRARAKHMRSILTKYYPDKPGIDEPLTTD